MHSKQLQGRTCLITGGSRTLGAAIARRMAHYGAHVIVNYHQSEQAAQDLCEQIRQQGGTASALQADISDPQQALALLDATERLGKVDILVNNVGHYVDTPFLDLTLADFDTVMDGNIRASFVLAQHQGRRMKERGYGQIINIAATDAFHRSHSVYGMAKQAVIYLTEALALELAPEAQIFALAPDLIADNEDMDAAFAASAVAATPQGRLVQRQEVAELACLLCTPTFTMSSGRTFVLDGARSIPRMHG